MFEFIVALLWPFPDLINQHWWPPANNTQALFEINGINVQVVLFLYWVYFANDARIVKELKKSFCVI